MWTRCSRGPATRSQSRESSAIQSRLKESRSSRPRRSGEAEAAEAPPRTTAAGALVSGRGLWAPMSSKTARSRGSRRSTPAASSPSPSCSGSLSPCAGGVRRARAVSVEFDPVDRSFQTAREQARGPEVGTASGTRAVSFGFDRVDRSFQTAREQARGPEVGTASGALDLELGGDDLDREWPPPTHDVQLRRAADQVARHQPLKIVDLLDRDAVDLDDQVLRAQVRCMGGAALDDLDDLDCRVPSEPGREPWRQRPRAARDAEVCAPEAAFGHKRADDLPGGGVDRDGEPETEAGNRRVDPDHLRACVRERTAGVARIERRIGLDDVLDDAAGRNR